MLRVLDSTRRCSSRPETDIQKPARQGEHKAVERHRYDDDNDPIGCIVQLEHAINLAEMRGAVNLFYGPSYRRCFLAIRQLGSIRFPCAGNGWGSDLGLSLSMISRTGLSPALVCAGVPGFHFII